MDKFKKHITNGDRKDARQDFESLLGRPATPKSQLKIQPVEVDKDRWAKAVVHEYGETLAALGRE